MCPDHLYAGVLPCPWPSCRNGTDAATFQIGKGTLRRQMLGGALVEPAYVWIIDDASAAHCIGNLVRRGLAALNAEPSHGDDGYLYHFTPPDGLVGILNSRELWLTDFRWLSDKTEINHGLGIAREVVQATSEALAGETVELLEDVLGAPLPNGFFVACFAMLSNSPVHWKEYADDERGAALVLDPLHFEPLVAVDPRAINVTRVAYQPGEKRELFRQLALWTDAALKFDVERGILDRDAYREEVQRLLPELLPICKDESYEKEHETRLIVIPELALSEVVQNLPIRCRETSGRTVDYITTRDMATHFELPILEILVGPQTDATIIRKAESVGVRVRRVAS